MIRKRWSIYFSWRVGWGIIFFFRYFRKKPLLYFSPSVRAKECREVWRKVVLDTIRKISLRLKTVVSNQFNHDATVVLPSNQFGNWLSQANSLLCRRTTALRHQLSTVGILYGEVPVAYSGFTLHTNSVSWFHGKKFDFLWYVSTVAPLYGTRLYRMVRIRCDHDILNWSYGDTIC
jgi:hypothetical protein